MTVWEDRVIVTAQIGSAPLADGDAHPRLAREDRALAERNVGECSPSSVGAARQGLAERQQVLEIARRDRVHARPVERAVAVRHEIAKA